MQLDCFTPLSYKAALIRATENECIPRGGGALAGQLGRCLKTIDEIGPHGDRVLFLSWAEQWYFSLESVGFHNSEKKSVIMGLTIAEILNILKEEQKLHCSRCLFHGAWWPVKSGTFMRTQRNGFF